jgi:hypothetical protein
MATEWQKCRAFEEE